MKITKDFRNLYDYLQAERPDILEWCKQQAHWHQCPIGAIITWKEEAIRRLMEKPPKEADQ